MVGVAATAAMMTVLDEAWRPNTWRWAAAAGGEMVTAGTCDWTSPRRRRRRRRRDDELLNAAAGTRRELVGVGPCAGAGVVGDAGAGRR